MQRHRLGMVCERCRYRYVLSPKVFPYVPDRRVAVAARRAGGNGARWYTARQVVGEMVRRKRMYLGLTTRSRRRRFDAACASVIEFHSATSRLSGLVSEPALDGIAPQHWPEPDLLDYGAERVLVVDDALVVDLLVRNWVHVNARAAIVSAGGYPAAVLPAIRALVASRPDVPIAVLHSSGASGMDVARGARDLLGAPESSIVRDLGLGADSPTVVKALRWARRMGDVPVDVLPHHFLAAGLVGVLTGTATLETVQAADDGGDGVLLAWLASDDDFG